MADLIFAERPAAGTPCGLLVLHHGRGTDERDLLGLADALDPRRRFHVVSPRAPLQLPGSSGYHWYQVRQVGYPDPVSFWPTYEKVGAFHDELAERTGIPLGRAVLGGFSQGTVMSYALGLGADRPVPAGILAFSGFVPVVDGWEPALEARKGLPVLIGHGSHDPIISVEFGRQARDLLQSGGLTVEYVESEVGHHIDPRHGGVNAVEWLATLADRCETL
jgi:phospholipase/carboxylesterase